MKYVHEDIESGQVIDRFVMGTLSEEERTAFEDYLMDHPECLKDVEIAEAFQLDLKRAAARELFQDAVVRTGIMAWLASRGMRYGAIGAVLVTVLVLGVFRVPMNDVGGPAVFTLDVTRAESSTVYRVAPNATAFTLVQPLVDSDGRADFTVMLELVPENLENQVVFEQNYRAQQNELRISPGLDLSAGEYVLLINQLVDGSPMPFAEYRFRIERR